MSYKASSTKERFDELQKNPLIFCKFEPVYEQDDMGHHYLTNDWSACDSTIVFRLKKKDLPHYNRKTGLFVIGKQILSNGKVDKEKEGQDLVDFEIAEFDTNKVKDWILVFNDCQYNYRSGNTRHCHMTLFWALYLTEWKKETIQQAFSKVSQDVAKTVCDYISSNIFAFSQNKQYVLIDILKGINPNLQPRVINDVEAALKEIAPSTDFSDYGFYQKVDSIVNFGAQPEQRKHLQKLYTTSLNRFIRFKYWMEHVGNKFFNYDYLETIYSYVGSLVQLSIVKRYLHDVRIKLIDTDYLLMQKLRDIRLQAYVDIRYFITQPGDNIDLVAPMFCDALLTLKKSEGQKIQDFNGILDFAVRNSNKAYPKIDVGIRHFVPICDGGLMHNSSFLGFIHYAIQYTFDASKLTEERLKQTIDYLINKYASLQYHDCCSADNKELTNTILKKCKNVICILKKWIENGHIRKAIKRPACKNILHEPTKSHVWRRTSGKYDTILSLFIDNIESKEYIKTEDLKIEKLKQSLLAWGNKYSTFSFMNGNPPENLRKKEVAYHIVMTYYSPTTMVIYPNDCMFYSRKKSLLGVWDDKVESPNQKRAEIAQSAESPIVFANTFASLKKMFPNAEVGKNYVKLKYDSAELSKIKAYYHYRSHEYDPETGYNDTKLWNKEFLTPRRIQRVFYCTPKVADSREKVSGLPFFWCRSDECFCNMLDEQTLDKQEDWRKYTLYHAAEILGYKLIEVTEEGNIPVEAVLNFVAEVRQAEKLYARLICRSCGHMIFSTRGTLLNGSRFFSCANSLCSQFRTEIYLSHCNHCKKDLIDSRDSKKCENGWVICPSCLSCCNDNLFDMLIARHRRNGYIPSRLQECEGKGHNNKNIFFCPQCGTQLGDISVEGKVRLEDGTEDVIVKTVFGCPQCHKSYEKEFKTYRSSQNNFKTATNKNINKTKLETK